MRTSKATIAASASPTQPSPPTQNKVSESPTSMPRGEVTIDPRRQQLIGVKTVPVTRGSVEQAIRAAGTVRYDETRQADINLKVEGWTLDVYVDYTGKPIQHGQR